MIDAVIGIYVFAWWGVFMLLTPAGSLIRAWAFIPAAVCAFGFPLAMACLFEDANVGTDLLVSVVGLLPFGTLAVILIRRWKGRKHSPNQAVHAIGAGAPQHDG